MGTRHTPLYVFRAVTTGGDSQKFSADAKTAMEKTKMPHTLPIPDGTQRVEGTSTPKEETPLKTLERLKNAKVGSKFTLPPSVNKLMNAVEGKKKLVAKKKDFTTEDKQIIAQIFGVIQKFVSIPDGSPVFGTTPGQYTEAWNRAKRQNAENADEFPLFPTFLFNVLYVMPDDPTNNILVCAAALLLDLSCIIDDFADHVRRTRKDNRFDCCVVTNCGNELDLLWESGVYIQERGTEMAQIRGWAEGEEGKRSEFTLSIGGESGSGKTRAAHQCASFYRTKNPSVQKENVLTVYIKVGNETTSQWYLDVEAKDEFTRKAARIMQEMWNKNEEYKRLFPECKSHAFLEECIKNSAADKNDLRRLRVAQGYKWVCETMRQHAKFPYTMKSKKPFDVAFIVLDEIGSCPWLYKAVNGNSTDGAYITKFFTDDTSFAKKYQFICSTTASESIFRNLCTSPGQFNAVTMKPSSILYRELLIRKKLDKNVLIALWILDENHYFESLVQNRRCAVLAVERIGKLMSTVTLISSTAGDMNVCQKKRSNVNERLPDILFNLTDKEGMYAAAGFLVGLVAAEYKKLSGVKNINPIDAQEIVAKGIRAFLCCEEEDFENVFSEFPQNPLELGLFDCRTEPQKDGTRRVTISVSAAQQVMAATAYGGGAIFTCSVSGGAFETFSASLLSTYLSGYSKSKMQIEGLPPANLSTFLNSVSATKFSSTYDNPLVHPSVSGVLFSPHQIALNNTLGSYLSVLAQFHGGSEERQAFVLVNGRGAPYADLIAKSGDILFLVQCKGSIDIPKFTVEEELRKMGFSDKGDVEIEALVSALFPGDVVDEKKLGKAIKIINSKKGNFHENFKKCLDAICGKKEWQIADPDAAFLKGQLLTSLLMRSLGCTIAVPVFMCSDSGTDKVKDDLKDLVESHKVNSFGWNDPAALLFVGGGIERSIIVKDRLGGKKNRSVLTLFATSQHSVRAVSLIDRNAH
ncbi:hypothetical protein AGDE_16543 [Angomonas deanei]|uniref:Uncharacterized protein n=1 Tax=Angomonas deanei TaxID=59799 RepID=A0A7G2CS72_9TRYP|nr:hypothetical protein AGDE_16543 [Angomonas deanei]CAD2222385.1 hypothetical protein, conserved [Angomonas deanei]|eukprot:EPY16913.1 hypothetical protein AGDE_16543 [Angomonas deanei]